MASRTLTLKARDGLHIRPAAQFVQEAKKYSSDIIISASGKESNAKSLFKLQLLEITEGTELSIRAVGDDASEAVDSLAQFLESLQ